MDDWVIEATHVSKYFQSAPKKPVLNNLRRTANGNGGVNYALNDISFALKKGEVMGIIGMNGAGKSTLLKAINGITKPSSGQIKVRGRLGSMLEIGAGFSPDLTGRENVFLAGQMIGIAKNEIDQKLDEIISFSGIAGFIDTPVKYYSSGMYVRLAFSTLSILDMDILLLDEISTVGDADFRSKSNEAIKRLAQSGRSIILVSHNLQEVQSLCTRAIWLDNGVVCYDGEASDAIEKYIQFIYNLKKEGKNIEVDRHQNPHNEEQSALGLYNHAVEWLSENERPGNDLFRLTKIQVNAKGKDANEAIYLDEDIEVTIEYFKLDDKNSVNFVLQLQNANMINVLGDCDLLRYSDQPVELAKGNYRLTTTIPGNLLSKSMYMVSLIALKNKWEPVGEFFRLVNFYLTLNPKYTGLNNYKFVNHFTNAMFAVTRPNLAWNLEHFDGKKPAD
jgi:lipopolysaccharide transport system ATP-binding protein